MVIVTIGVNTQVLVKDDSTPIFKAKLLHEKSFIVIDTEISAKEKISYKEALVALCDVLILTNNHSKNKEKLCVRVRQGINLWNPERHKGKHRIKTQGYDVLYAEDFVKDCEQVLICRRYENLIKQNR
jgi:hypothetical protein